jgi:hypothetical protein
VHEVHYSTHPGTVFVPYLVRGATRVAVVRVLICHVCRLREVVPYFVSLPVLTVAFWSDPQLLGWVLGATGLVMAPAAWFGRMTDKSIERAVFSRHVGDVSRALKVAPGALLHSW